MAFCRSSFVAAFATASSVALVMTIKRIVWARKRASFNTPSQICPVIKRFMPSIKDKASHPKDKEATLNLGSVSFAPAH